MKDIWLYLYHTYLSHFISNKCSLLYGTKDPSIGVVRLDSSFPNLYDMMVELVDVHVIRFPKFTMRYSDATFHTNLGALYLFDVYIFTRLILILGHTENSQCDALTLHFMPI